RTSANRAAFLGRVDGWVGAAAARVSAVLGDLSTHRALGVLPWALAHPRWGFGFRPTCAADRNRIEPRRRVLRPPAPKGRRGGTWRGLAPKGGRCETGAEVCGAVAPATASGTARRPPFAWGRRTRRRAARRPGRARLPLAAQPYRLDHLGIGRAILTSG